MKIAAYLRVSTKDQKVDIQLEAIQNYCKLKGWINPVLFIDHGESGAKVSRPQLDKMFSRVRTGEFDAILCWKFDRIGRSMIHLLTIMEELKHLKVEFISIQENIDTTSPLGKVFFSLLASLAEFERDNITSRTKAGRELAMERGVIFGRKPWKMTPDIGEDIVVMYAAGHSMSLIGKKHGINKSVVSRHLKKVEER